MKLTVESLDVVLDKGDETPCLALFDEATEKERQAVADLAIRRFKKISEQWMIETKPGSFQLNPLLAAAKIAVVASCSLSQIRRFGWRAIVDGETASRIFSKRRPGWIDDWVAFALETNPRHFRLARRLMREGLCRRPEHDNYVLGMLDTHASDLGRFASVCDGLLADPELLDEVWRLFEIEGNGEFSLAARDKYTHKLDGTWEHGLIALAGQGKLPRARLLDASLDALGRDFAQFRAGWFSRFHEALHPTLEERAGRAQRYLHLLGSRIAPTVSFALKSLAILDKANRLSSQSVVDSIGPALAAREKGTVLAALKLLARVGRVESGQQTTVALLSTGALAHESADVQSAALDLIERCGASGDKRLTYGLRERAEGLAASQRPRLTAYLEKLEGMTKTSSPREASLEVGRLVDQAAKLDNRLRELAGIDTALAAVREEGDLPPALDFELMAIPHLDPNQAIRPIRDLEELIDRNAPRESPPPVKVLPTGICVQDGRYTFCKPRCLNVLLRNPGDLQ